MGANRASHPSSRPQSTIWTSSHSSTVLAAARAIGVIDFYSAKTGQRSSLKPFSLPSSVGRPTTISLRPSSSPPTYPLSVIGTGSGHVLLDQDIILQIGISPVLTCQYHDSSIVVVGSPGNSVVVIDPTTRAVTIRFSLASQHLSPITRVVIQDGSHALFCSQALTYVDLTTGKVKRRFVGHKTAVSAAASAFPFVITACEDSFLSVWSTDPSMKESTKDLRTKRRRTSGVANAETTLVAPCPGVRDLYIDKERNFCFTIAALMSSGDIAVWRSYDLSKTLHEGVAHVAPRPATFLVQTNSVSVHAALFSQNCQLTIFRGSPLKPIANTVSLENGSDGVNIELPEAQDPIIASKRNNIDRNLELINAMAKLETSNITPAEVLDTNLKKTERTPEAEDLMEGDVGKEVGQETNSTLTQDTKPVSTGGLPELEEHGEQTLEEKLKALGINNVGSASMKRSGGHGSLLEATRLDSRASVLLQAVRVKDSKMMETCIYTLTSLPVVQNTIKRIPSNVAAGDLLEMLVQRLKDRHEQVEVLSLWIKVILMEYAGAIISQRRQDAISALARVIEDRTKSLDTLSRLQGRLELIVGQTRRIKPIGPSQLEPAAEYVEDEDSGDEDEDGDDDEDEEERESGDEDSLEEEKNEGNGEASGEDTESAESTSDDEDTKVKDDGHGMQIENGWQSHDSEKVGAIGEGNKTASSGEDSQNSRVVQVSDKRPNGQMNSVKQSIEAGGGVKLDSQANGKMEVSDSENSDVNDSDVSGDDVEGEV